MKDVAPANMDRMVVTDEVAHSPMGWLKDDALANMPFMVVTDEVFQPDISALNAPAPGKPMPPLWNSLSIFVTFAVSHPSIGPYLAAADEGSARYLQQGEQTNNNA